MELQHDQLSKLKELLDSGALTEEEFSAAKKRILNINGEPEIAESEHGSNPLNNTTISKVHNNRWIVVALFVAISIFIIILLATRGCNEEHNITNNSDESAIIYPETSIDTFEDDFAFSDEINSDEDMKSFAGWQKDYYHNEWGEEILSDPFIYTIIDGESWDIHLDYTPPTDVAPEFFRLYLLDSDGRKTEHYSPVTILVRGSDGETKGVEVTQTNNGITYVADPSTVSGLKYYLDNEAFDILMEFGKWNERHSTRGRWYKFPNSFQKAADKLL